MSCSRKQSIQQTGLRIQRTFITRGKNTEEHDHLPSHNRNKPHSSIDQKKQFTHYRHITELRQVNTKASYNSGIENEKQNVEKNK